MLVFLLIDVETGVNKKYLKTRKSSNLGNRSLPQEWDPTYWTPVSFKTPKCKQNNKLQVDCV